MMLKLYCVAVMSFIALSKYDKSNRIINDISMNLLLNLHKDIRNKYKKGQTKKQIEEYYWGESFFRQVWERLGLTKQNFDLLVTKK